MIGLHALGSVRVTRQGDDLPLGGPRQRRLLAVLLIHRDEVVSVDQIAEAVFAGSPSAAAGTTLRSYVARLRKVLGADVVTRPPGYQLITRTSEFDVAAFERGIEEGRTALQRGDPASAREFLQHALARWQGRPYAEFADEDWAYPEAERLGELRLGALELLMDAEMGCGRAQQVVPELEALRREHPLREQFRAQLVTAYARTGRQADALAELRSFRRELAEELGIDPGPALVDLERRILAQDQEVLTDQQRGTPLRGYVLGERLGTGREGTVFAARIPGVDRQYVVHALRSDLADDRDFVRCFESVAHQVASLRHPAVLPVHDYWREPGAAYVVTARVFGGTLRDRLDRGPLPAADLSALVGRVGGALVVAAGAGVVHGRVNPGNILYDAAGHPVLTDFWLGGPKPFPQPDQDTHDLVTTVRECLDSDDPRRSALDDLLDRLAGDPELGIGGVVDALSRTVGGRAAPPVQQLNPYQGLRPFDESDSGNYFGRQKLVEEMVDRLSGMGVSSRLLLLVGASGTGKSSVVRAGLVPRLRAGAVPGSSGWFIVPMLPGGAPYEEFVAALRRVATLAVEDIRIDPDDPSAVDRIVRAVVPEKGQLVLVVDQFEELFTLSPEDEQRSFLAALTHAVTTSESRLRVVATLRADYYDRPLAFQPFGSLVNNATVTMPPMLPAEIEAAVVEPAHRVGREVERPLAAQLVAALAHEPAALPALQFVLYELAARSEEATLTLAAYTALGGVDGAVAARAEEIYRALDDEQRSGVRTLFERLVVIGADGVPTRRRASRDEIGPVGDLVDRWVQARLLSLDVHPQTRVPTVELAHEALIREWPRLRDWVSQDRTDLVVLSRLRETSATWADLDRDASALYRGGTLEAALDVAARHGPLAPLEREFVDASVAAHEEARHEQAEQLRRQQRTNRRLRAQLATIAVALVVAVVGGFVAVDQRGQAVRERHIATARELAAAADANLREDPERSILLALRAVDSTKHYGEAVLPEAVEALHRAVSSSRVLASFPGAGGALDWSPDGKWFTTEGKEESGLLDIRDARTGKSAVRVHADAVDINDVAFSGNSRMVATAGDSGSVAVWDVRSGRQISRVGIPHAGPVWGPAISPDNRLAAAAFVQAGKVRVFRPRTGRVVARFALDSPMDTTFSPDGRRLAVTSWNTGWVYVYDAATGRRLFRLDRNVAGPREVAWSPNGRWLALAQAGADDALVFDARHGHFLFPVHGHIAEVAGVAWSPDSRRLATASDDGTAKVHLIQGDSAAEQLTLSAQDMGNGVRGVAFSPDGTRLMTGDWAITAVKVWDVRPDGAGELGTFATATKDSSSVGVPTPDGRSIYLAHDSRGVERVDLATRRRTAWLPWPARASSDGRELALSPDGRLLAAMSSGLPFPVFDTASRKVAFYVKAPGDNPDAWWSDAMDWSGDGAHLAVTLNRSDGGAPALLVFDRSGRVRATMAGERGTSFVSVSLGPAGLVAVTAANQRDDPKSRGIRLWNWRTGQRMGRIPALAAFAALDPTGRRVVTSIFVHAAAESWDVRTRQRLFSMRGHSGVITGVAYSPDGRLVATASQDGSTRVWYARTGNLRVVLRDPVPTVGGGAVFTEDGHRLVTSGWDGYVRVWALDLDELIALAHSKLTRGLTAPECREYLHLARCP